MFRTAVPLTRPPFQIHHRQPLLLLGSCFTEHIGARLEERKFQSLTNPFGIVYNPASMSECLERLAEGDRPFSTEEIFQHDGLWHSWLHHGRFSHPDQAEMLRVVNRAYTEGVQFLKETQVLLLTLGTSVVFTLRENGRIVANNHKMPAAGFNSMKLSVAEIVEKTAQAIEKVKAVAHPELKVILTVSPVRHLRLGPVENQRSKARLLLACEELAAKLDQVYYFPASELLLDDLRDYRFYAADMLHPSETAVQYIWQFFEETYFSAETRRLNERIEKLRAAAMHRPFHPETPQHRAFLRAQLQALYTLKAEMPDLDFSMEENTFKSAAI